MLILVRTTVCLTALWLAAGGCSKASDKQKRKRPDRQAAVLSAVSGEAFFRSAGGETWHPASAGFTLVSGDAISTGARSRAEVQARAPAALLRVGENAGFILEQSDSAGARAAHAKLMKGAVWGSVKSLEEGEAFALSGPAFASALGPATFRMEAREDGTTTVSVYEGEVRVQCAADPGRLEIHTLSGGQRLLIAPGASAQRLTVAPDDLWRRGWKAADQEDQEPVPQETRRIEEKPRPRPPR